jgi:hypothetical protein
MGADFVSRAFNDFLNRSHVWRKAQTFLTPAGKKQVATASFTIGAEAADVINVAIQLKDNQGNDIGFKAKVNGCYLSSDAAGDVLEATAPDAIAIGTDGTIFKSGGDSLHLFDLKSEVDGDIDLDITEATGADTVYLNVVIDGVVYTSGAITFAA